MNWSKCTTLAMLVAMVVTAPAVLGQAKLGTSKPSRANVALRFAKDNTVGASCSQIVGEIEQSMLRIDGVKNVKVDLKGVQVSFDPSQTTPEKIVAGFNKENPDTLLQLSDTKPGK